MEPFVVLAALTKTLQSTAKLKTDHLDANDNPSRISHGMNAGSRAGR